MTGSQGTFSEEELEQIAFARAGLTQIIEPADALATQIITVVGPLRAAEFVQGSAPTHQEWTHLVESFDDLGLRGKSTRKLREILSRWKDKRDNYRPAAILPDFRRNRGGFLIPEDHRWPVALNRLDHTTPVALWTRGPGQIPSHSHSVAVVGSREISPYGRRVTEEFVSLLRHKQRTIISGGAYGVDAQAHRTALATDSGQKAPISTMAVMAGGLDQYYPSGNQELLADIARTGVLISELPPGARPNRYRFLNRNRLIAALSSLVLIPESRWRSGAQNTAHHALEMGIAVAVVPGSIHSAASAGCHRLLSETPATIVFDHHSLTEMLDDIGPVTPVVPADQESHCRYSDVLDQQLSYEQLILYDALPLRRYAAMDEICAASGLSAREVARNLPKLSRAGLVHERHGQYQAQRVAMSSSQ
ncbi:DNA-processing protein DprA [Auritidibacter ignavus]|uniref:DNA-processing protein DprA n=1 Tax=Auritidibacter ignavus TaxID=678932 RepID=A0AAJ6API9_9MICC|nr:DNA-processing protein DprA [Auritidibacter ignavus]WGH93474.1 DNA-processing protein DprA [Auritidibacter ignavus]